MAASTSIARSVGAHCQADADCESDLVCVTEEMPGVIAAGGPAAGYCTAACSSSADCAALDELSSCLFRAENDGFCISRCLAGVGGELKCTDEDGARLQACTVIGQPGSTIDVCLPRCNSNADCTGGRVCDLGVDGACVDPPSAVGAVGAACTLETQVDDCASGSCQVLADGRTLCAGFCSFGSSLGCGFDNDPVDNRTAACVSPQRVDGDLGDLGQCFELCDVADDCIQAGSECVLLTDPANVTRLGRDGFCDPPPVGGAVGADAGVQ